MIHNETKSLHHLQKLRESHHQKVKVAASDIDGILRGKYLNKDKFLASTESGFGMCNVLFGWDSGDSCYRNSTYTGWHTGYPDVLAKIDLASHRQIPWENDVPFFLCDFEDVDGDPLPLCPRNLLKKVLLQADKMGYRPMCGMEFEWFNFKETGQSLSEKQFTDLKTISEGMFGYSLLRMNQSQPFFSALMEEMGRFGVPLEGIHTETGPGVFEAAILYSDALEAADRAVLFKTGAKEIGHRFGIMASFMAKWKTDLPGCSGHIHQSLWNSGNQTGSHNLFHDEKDPAKMSSLFKSYLAGQMHCLPEILPFFAPTVNSYKRLVDGYWAPTRVAWGIDNRTVAFRVIPGNSKSTRTEMRVPGSDVNPYLAMAASIASGLYGIEKNLTLQEKPMAGSAYIDPTATRLPENLMEATQKLARSKVARELFGEEFVDHFVKTRIWEWKQFQESVTDWELQRYFEII